LELNISKKVLVVAIGVIVLVALFGGYFAYGKLFSLTNTVANGDAVKVIYTLKLDDGTVFDTNDQKVAEDNNIFSENKKYEPLEITVGSGQVIKGFDTALVGMRKGQTKAVTLSPEEGYGKYDPTKITNISRKLEISRIIVSNISESYVPADIFADHFIGNVSVGNIVTETQSKIKFEVLAVNDTTITVIVHYDIGDNITIPTTGWPATVIATSPSSITWQQNLPENFTTPFGKPDVELTKNKITLTVNPEVGVQTSSGKVLNVTGDQIFLDVNPPLAGKTLTFDITIVDITKKQEPTNSS